MDDEKLILLVQENELIYNKFHPNYKFPEKKKAAWKEIGLLMGHTDEVCIKRWTSLRDRYGREKRLDDVPSGSRLQRKPRWYLMSAMEFLDPYITPRPMRSSINVLSEFSQTLQSPSEPFLLSPQWENLDENILTFDVSTNATQNTECQNTESQNEESPKSESQNRAYRSTESFKKRTKVNMKDIDIAFVEAVNTFKNFCNEGKKSEYNDMLEGFGKMILSTLASMSPSKQTKAIQKVTLLVMEIKMEPEV